MAFKPKKIIAPIPDGALITPSEPVKSSVLKNAEAKYRKSEHYKLKSKSNGAKKSN